MTKTMKAAVVHAFGEPLTIEDVPIPEPGEGQVLVRIVASGVCHTDLHAANGDWPVKPTLPFIPGHEGAGTVAEVGRSVTLLKEGDRVGFPGCIAPAASANTASRDGKRSVPDNKTPATRSTAVTPNTSWRRRRSRRRFRIGSDSSMSLRSSAPASPPTKA